MSCEAGEISTILPGAATSPRLARRFVDDALASWALDELRDPVELLTCELVTNVVLHVRGELVLRLVRLHGRLRVEVGDSSPVELRVPSHALDEDYEASTGRGLLLVEALASDWGVAPNEGGKTVWFEIAA